MTRRQKPRSRESGGTFLQHVTARLRRAIFSCVAAARGQPDVQQPTVSADMRRAAGAQVVAPHTDGETAVEQVAAEEVAAETSGAPSNVAAEEEAAEPSRAQTDVAAEPSHVPRVVAAEEAAAAEPSHGPSNVAAEEVSAESSRVPRVVAADEVAAQSSHVNAEEMSAEPSRGPSDVAAEEVSAEYSRVPRFVATEEVSAEPSRGPNDVAAEAVSAEPPLRPSEVAAETPGETGEEAAVEDDTQTADTTDETTHPDPVPSGTRDRRQRVQNWVSTHSRNQQNAAPASTGALPAVPEDVPALSLPDSDQDDTSSGSLETQAPDLPGPQPVPGRAPNRLVPGLRPVAASASSASQEEQERAQQERGHSSSARSSSSVREQARARMSGPSHSATTADSDLPAPARADSHEPADEPPTALPRGTTSWRIVSLSHHDPTDHTYMLVRTDSGFHVCRLQPGDREIDLSFTVTDDSRLLVSMVLAGRFLLVCLPGRLLRYDLYCAREQEASTRHCSVVDMAGTNSSVLCLLQTGDIMEYTVPSLEQVRLTAPPGQTRGDEFRRIAASASHHHVTIMSVNLESRECRVRVYDAAWACVRSVPLPYRAEPCLCACGDELLVGGEGRLWTWYVYYLHHARAAAARVEQEGLRWAGEVTALCQVDADQVLVATSVGNLSQLDLRDVRARCPRSGGTTPSTDWPHVRIEAQELFNFRDAGRLCIDKSSGELLQMSDLGHVTVYGRDVARPLDSFQLSLPDGVSRVRRFDTTEEGELVAIGYGGRLMIFSPDRQLRWSTDLGVRTRDVVSVKGRIYVLLDEEIVVFSNEHGEPAERQRLALRLEDHRPDYTRLAVHGQLVYLLVPERLVLRMDLSQAAPAFSTFTQEPGLIPWCLAVTGEGQVVVGGEWIDSSGAWQTVLHVYSPCRQEVRRLPIRGEYGVYDLALCPGGGVFIKTSGSLQFLEHF